MTFSRYGSVGACASGVCVCVCEYLLVGCGGLLG